MNKNPLTYLESLSILKNFKNYEKNINIKFSASGEYSNLKIFLKAEAAKSNVNLNLDLLPFGSLRKYLINENKNFNELIILFPWDFIPSLDWRTGIVIPRLDEENIYFNEIYNFIAILSKRKNSKIIYVEAPIPPLSNNIKVQENILREIEYQVHKIGAYILYDHFFSLDNYLISGCPIERKLHGVFAKLIIDYYLSRKSESKKLVITDLDYTLWNGVLGEDGINNLNASPEGQGYIHFIYQTMLKRLKEFGILLSIVTKNDSDLVLKSFNNKNFILNTNDFVTICANYEPKSLQIKQLVKQLSIGLEHVIFVDDSIIEIEEVSKSIPEIECIQFPKNPSDLVSFCSKLNSFFQFNEITTEDKNRTELYKKMKLPEINISGKGYNLNNFLKSLSMTLKIYNKKIDIIRAIQLINKTNQFNINGDRWKKEEAEKILSEGGKIITGELLDINGNYGEVLVLFMNKDQQAMSFVMSCRIFDRKAEFVFLASCFQKYQNLDLLYKKTKRNLPLQNFLLEIFSSLDIKNFVLKKSNLEKISKKYNELFNVDFKNNE